METTMDKIKDFIGKNYRYIIIGVLAVVLVAVIIIIVLNVKKKEPVEAGTEVTVDTLADEAVKVPSEKLQMDAFADVNTFTDTYFKAIETGDVATLIGITTGLEEEEQRRIVEKAKFVESYSNFVRYTKQGPEDKSYIAFVSYDVKFVGVDTPAPSLTSLYICTNDSGALYVNSGELDDNTISYIKEISVQDDVVELLTKVDTKYAESVDGDAKLKEFMDALPSAIDSSVETAKAAETAAAEAAAAELAAAEAAKAETVKTIDAVNVRKSASETADKLGKTEIGAEFMRLESMDNGWSKIEYEGGEAYIRSDFLEVVAAVETGEGALPEGEAAEAPTETAEAPAETAKAETSTQTIKIKEAVNVRKSPSEEGEKIGLAQSGETYDGVKQSDGWTKITFSGQTAYVKSDYVE